MAVEPQRGYGYRKVGGTYLEGGGAGAHCDRLPIPLIPCPTCGAGPQFMRGIAQINPHELWGDHKVGEGNTFGPGDTSKPVADRIIEEVLGVPVLCPENGCPACRPNEKAFLMWVGSEYTETSFVEEAERLGVSKRIPAIPKDLVIGRDWVYMAKLYLIPGTGQFWIPGTPNTDNGHARRGWGPGVFYAFRPQRLVRIITESQAVEGLGDQLLQQGITPVVVPDDDPDHNPAAGKKASPQSGQKRKLTRVK